MRRMKLLTVNLPSEDFQKLDRALETLGRTGVKPTRAALVRAALDVGLDVVVSRCGTEAAHGQ